MNLTPFSTPFSQLAEQLGVAQQTLAHYEAGRLRLLASTLAKLADALDAPVEDLIGTHAKRTKAGKRGPAPKIQQQLEQIEALPKGQAARHRARARLDARAEQRLNKNPAGEGGASL